MITLLGVLAGGVLMIPILLVALLDAEPAWHNR